MAIVLKRQLNDEEKQIVLGRHGRKDWVSGREIPQDEPLHYDHILPFGRGGDSDLNNIAPMSQETNLKKGALTLAEFQTKLRVERFFETGPRLTLGNLLSHLKDQKAIPGWGAPLRVDIADRRIELTDDNLRTFTAVLQQCPTTGWRYFYATFPVDLLDSDDDTDSELGLQPRYLIQDKVFGLYRHFLNHPVLQPSIGRIDGQRIRLFDGQHKVAGLLFGTRREFECKIYIDADRRQLNQTNIAAHDAYAQTRFYSSIMVMKLGAQFGRDFEEYRADNDGKVKSEAGLLRWLQAKEDYQLRAGDLNKRLRSFLYKSVIEDQTNKLATRISVENRGTKETPLTTDQLERSLFSDFMFREALEDDMASQTYLREEEFANIVFVMNQLHESAMHRWNPLAPKNDSDQLPLERMFRSKSMMAWSELLHAAVCGLLELQDSDERAKPFQRKLREDDRNRIARAVQRLCAWQGWQARPDSDIDRRLADNESQLRKWFKEQGLTASYLMGAPD